MKKRLVQTLFGLISTTNIYKKTTCVVHGFPTSVNPYNTMYDVKRKLPLFTKSQTSQKVHIVQAIILLALIKAGLKVFVLS